ncbi:MAG: hypothetical protein ACK44T_13305 [Sphingomonadales bacterium]|jgi:hypothetical protein
MPLTKHAKVEISVAMLFLLASCNSNPNKFSDNERDEIADIAYDAAVDALGESNLESRISEIESRLNM